jgi:hypothetical protein
LGGQPCGALGGSFALTFLSKRSRLDSRGLDRTASSW